jgi:hypothetical protein
MSLTTSASQGSKQRIAKGEVNMLRKLIVVLIALFLLPGLFAQSTGGGIQTATVTLSSAQLLSLRATPVQLVPPPGAGNVIKPLSITLQYKSGSAPYTAQDGSFAIGTPAFVAAVQQPAVGFIDQASDQFAFLGGFGGAFGPRSSFENQPITVSQNGSAEWTAGDGSVVISVTYTVVALQ